MAFTIPTQLNKAKTFLDSVLEKLPEGEREGVRAQYSAAQDEVSGIARQIGTAVQTVNQKATEQATWWEQNKDRVVANPNPNPNPNRNPIAAAVDREALAKDWREEIGKTADQLAAQGLYLSSMLPTLIDSHRAEFGEGLNGPALIKAATEAGMELESYYNQSVAKRRQDKQVADQTAREVAAEARGRQAGIMEATKGNVPYPIGSRGPTTLDGLRPPAEGQQKPNSLDAAVATAMEVMAKQAS